MADTGIDEDFQQLEEEIAAMPQLIASFEQQDGIKEIIFDPTRTESLQELYDATGLELDVVARESVREYLSQAEDLVSLHQGVKECDDVLKMMEEVLYTFETDLRSVSQDIQALQNHSKQLTMRHTNRAALHREVSGLVEQLVLPPDLVRTILDQDIKDEGYLADLETLNFIAHHSEDLRDQGVQSAGDVLSVSQTLCMKAVRKARDFQLKLIFGLRKPKTNVQILQNSVLLKYSYLNRFLFINSPTTANEIRVHYVETVSRIYSGYFKAYIKNLAKLSYTIADKTDLLGMPEEKKKAMFSQKQVHKNRASVFSLTNANVHAATAKAAPALSTSPTFATAVSDSPLLSTNRATILSEVEQTPSIIPHVAVQHGLKYPYEYVFHSMVRLLVDTAYAEHMFIVEFFGRTMYLDPETGMLFTPIFTKILTMITENLQGYLAASYDCLGLLLMIGIAGFNKDLLKSKRRVSIPPLETYIGTLEQMIWDRLNKLLESNIDSIKTATPKTLGGVDTQRLGPHYVTRRYAEFAASVHTINCIITGRLSIKASPDEKITAWMTVLRTAIERLLDKLVQEVSDPRGQTVFLMNNYSHILNVLREHQPDSNAGGDMNVPGTRTFNEDAARFDYCFNTQVLVFIEEELHRYYGPLISYIKSSDIHTTAQPLASSSPTPSSEHTSSSSTPIPIPGTSSSSSSSVTAAPLSTSPTAQAGYNAELVDKHATDFATSWKDNLERIHHDVMNFFNDFELGSDVLKKTLSQLVLYYKRFEEVYRRNSRSRDGTTQGKAFIPTSTLTYEITKRYSMFS
eukprot:TRINITY_DN5656_c0_g1_i1.p1 TRINITY_DN5656_c0_g1~~TRINITY_DN5656_c0_g1_i1.p1  ORF type:complete len:809 (-),score=252.78 TRINITY_DN5656_c0_g1_i1:9-2408(-)